MKIICAWCGKLIREDIYSSDLDSHGICPDCYEKMKEELKTLKEDSDE